MEPGQRHPQARPRIIVTEISRQAHHVHAMLRGQRAMLETCGSAGKGCTFPVTV